jgi:hypothetical protein
MTIKKALLLGFILALALILATVYLGHLWVFIFLVVITFFVISISMKSPNKEDSPDKRD